MHELDPIAKTRERRSRVLQRIDVAIETNHAVGSGLEQRTAVAAESHGAVDEEPAACGIEQRHRLYDEHRFVRREAHIPNSDSARASSSV